MSGGMRENRDQEEVKMKQVDCGNGGGSEELIGQLDEDRSNLSNRRHLAESSQRAGDIRPGWHPQDTMAKRSANS